MKVVLLPILALVSATRSRLSTNTLSLRLREAHPSVGEISILVVPCTLFGVPIFNLISLLVEFGSHLAKSHPREFIPRDLRQLSTLTRPHTEANRLFAHRTRR